MFSRNAPEAPDDAWKSKVLEKLVFSALKEQRATRRWGVFFKLFFIAYLTVVLLLTLPGILPLSGGSESHTALVKLTGTIAANSKTNSENIINSLQAAFESEQVKGVVLKINSPGGSPVQSDEIYLKIKSLREKYPEKPIYAVISDLGASGAYYVASATNAIYANESSLVGSIGVLYNGFGFVDAMKKLGVERRVYTAGKNKALMDPFSPLNEQGKTYLDELLKEFHNVFIRKVKEGRGDRLHGDDETLFSGQAWSGTQAIKLGLIDNFGTEDTVAKDLIGEETLVDYTVSENLLERISAKASSSFAMFFDQLSFAKFA